MTTKPEPRFCNACTRIKNVFMLELSNETNAFKWRICTFCTEMILDMLSKQAGCRNEG